MSFLVASTAFASESASADFAASMNFLPLSVFASKKYFPSESQQLTSPLEPFLSVSRLASIP